MTHFDKCINCNEPIKDADGVIDINEEGLCDYCAGRRERCRIITSDPEYILDHDHSMDY